MQAPNRCDECGGVLTPMGALGGSCPRCLMAAALGTGGSNASELALDLSTLPTIARYRVTRLIGQGGMGAVYEAEQEQPRRTVALKIIKPGMASPELLRRFEHETEALGRLQHPGIAQIYEAGTADTGLGPQPYFAMELIRGRSLVNDADERKLNTRARLEIMARICDAVQHAHQRGLIHRDLKPANILVDENGQPKVVDFGVARLTDRDVQNATQSGVGQLVGTLAYMSPEQVLADPLEIDTRSDVYALGVILYELLAGRLPYKVGGNLHESLSAIREGDPARLGTISPAFRGDIETIVAKAMEKEKSRRYSSAAEMAADLRRHLSDEPIMARPPSVRYQLHKFTRRHKSLVVGAALLLAGVFATTWQTVRVLRAEAQAKLASAEASLLDFGAKGQMEYTDAFMSFLDLGHGQPGVSPDTTLKQGLDAAVSRFQYRRRERLRLMGVEEGPIQISVEANILRAFAEAYGALHAYKEMQEQLERVVEIRKARWGLENGETLSGIRRLSYALARQGKLTEEINLLRSALHATPVSNSLRTTLVFDLVQANVDNHSFEEAERIQIKQLDNYGPFGRVDPLKRADALATLGWIRIQSGKYSEAEQVLLEACTLAENEPGAAGNCDSFVRVNPERRQYNNSGEIMTTSYMCAIQLPESVWPFANRCAYGLGSRTPKTGVWIGRMFEQWGKPQQVKEWIAKLQAHPPKIH